MTTRGYFTFTESRWLDLPPMIERETGSQLLAVPLAWTPPPAGTSVPLFFGGAVSQRSPKETHAPEPLGPAQLVVEMVAVSEEETLLISRLPGLLNLGPVRIWYPMPHHDEFVIPSAAKTTWTLSRETGGAWGLSETDLPTVVEIWDPADLRDSSKTTLTRSASSPPAGGEFYIDVAANATEIETLDLSASAAKLLMVRYYPVRQWGVSPGAPMSIPSRSDVGGLRISLALLEHVPDRTYAGLD